MTAKKNPLLTKREAIVLAWKQRSNYKGYDRSKGSAFNSWRSITNTAKGRTIGFPPEWKDFAVFMRDVAGEHTKGKIVVRLDTSKPHGADNSVWADKGTEVSSRLATLTHNGVTKTLVEWCAEFNLNYSGVRQRYYRGKNYTSQQILFGKIRRVRQPRESSFMLKTARMFASYRLSDKKKGLLFDITLDYMRDEVKNGCVYCGDTDRVGLDRIDNNLGHTKDNVLPCCYDCNVARGNNFTVTEMMLLGRTIRLIKEARHANRAKRAA